MPLRLLPHRLRPSHLQPSHLQPLRLLIFVPLVVGVALGFTAPTAATCRVTADDTQAIQQALDRCAGGGTVLVPAGTYHTGPLFLRNAETVQLEAGAVLLGPTDPAAYSRPGGGLYALINASGIGDIRLTGAGTIDGQGAGWWARVRAARAAGRADPPRPRLIELSHVHDVTVSGLTLQNSPSFHLVPSKAERVTVENLTIRAPADSPNTDGIDPSDARDVRIAGTTIDTGDDDIAIKAGHVVAGGAASAHITVENCTFLHGHGVSIGSETLGGVEDVRVQHSTFDGTTTALRIKTTRQNGGRVADLHFDDLQLRDVKTALSFSAYYPKIPASDAARPITATTPEIGPIGVTHLRATGVTSAGDVVGLPERSLGLLELSDVQIQAQSGLRVRNATVRLSGVQLQVKVGSPLLTEEGAEVSGTP